MKEAKLTVIRFSNEDIITADKQYLNHLNFLLKCRKMARFALITAAFNDYDFSFLSHHVQNAAK